MPRRSRAEFAYDVNLTAFKTYVLVRDYERSQDRQGRERWGRNVENDVLAGWYRNVIARARHEAIPRVRIGPMLSGLR
jgi:hypothetical protein